VGSAVRNTALDPDGYWVKIVGQNQSESASVSTNLEVYRLNHMILCVKGVERSMQFYRWALGMNLIRAVEQPEVIFGLYFLGCRREGEVGVYGMGVRGIPGG